MYQNVILSILMAAVLTLAAGCSDDESPTNVTPGEDDDRRAPAAVTDGVLTYSAATGTVRFEWTAPQDDDPTESVTSYEIRYTVTTGYEPPEFWDLSTPIQDPPIPLEPGTRQHFTFENVRRARNFYAGIRSVDECGNRSHAGDPAMVHIPGYSFEGRCVDVFTGEPLAGLEISFTSGVVFNYATDADGRFAHDKELDAGVTHVDIRTGAAPGDYHTLRQPFVLDRDTTHTFAMIPVRPVDADWTPNLLSLFKHMSRTGSSTAQFDLPSSTSIETGSLAGPPCSEVVTSLPGSSPPSPAPPAINTTVLAKWHERPVACFAPPFVNEYGIDYAEQARSAAQQWMDRTGEPLFIFVDAPPDTGIVLSYRSSMSGIGATVHTKGDDGHPIRDEIRIIDFLDDAPTVWLVFLHEFGHTIQLGHVSDRDFIMYVGHPLPRDVSDDEVEVVRLLEALPTRVDMSYYDESTP